MGLMKLIARHQVIFPTLGLTVLGTAILYVTIEWARVSFGWHSCTAAPDFSDCFGKPVEWFSALASWLAIAITIIVASAAAQQGQEERRNLIESALSDAPDALRLSVYAYSENCAKIAAFMRGAPMPTLKSASSELHQLASDFKSADAVIYAKIKMMIGQFSQQSAGLKLIAIDLVNGAKPGKGATSMKIFVSMVMMAEDLEKAELKILRSRPHNHLLAEFDQRGDRATRRALIDEMKQIHFVKGFPARDGS